MLDIARQAGVAKSTVSRALADSDQVSNSTKEKIRRIAEEHNYKINLSARNFRFNKTRTIKVIVPIGATGVPHFSDPFVMDLLASIADTLSDHDFNMLLSKVSLSSSESVREAFNTRTEDGVILIGQRRYHAVLNEIVENDKPLVVWGAQLPDQAYCSVGSDNVAGAKAAVRHLINLGHKKIAFLGDLSQAEPELRFQGYLHELERAGIAFDESLVIPTSYDRLSAYNEMSRRIDEGITFDAVFGTSDVVAMSTISALHDHGVSVPQDIAVVGYDDISLASYFSPSLTTVRQNIVENGAVIVDKVLAQLNGEEVQSYVGPTELIVRKSCGAVQ